MTIYQKTEIDLDAIRKNVKSMYPAGRDRRQLMKFYDLFESGEWTKAAKYAQKWGDAEGEVWNLRESIDETVWRAVFDHCCGEVYSIGVMRAIRNESNGILEYVDSTQDVY